MANTYTQLYVQLVFAVKCRQGLVQASWRNALEKYMTGIVQQNGHKLLAIYCMPDHCHILVGLSPKQAISDLVRDVKTNSSTWVRAKRLSPYRFQWQEGYGAFTYSRTRLSQIISYVRNQATHHSHQTFQAEYMSLLGEFDISFKDKYLFEFFDEGANS